MGICSSCESTAIATATAKLILQDGTLQEFPYPVKVSYILQKHPSTFICNSDHMDFDDVVSAVGDDDMLQPGQLYFALPLNRLKRRLLPDEMAALAVKASSALSKCGCRKKNNIYFTTSSTDQTKSLGRGNLDGGSVGSRSRRRRYSTGMLTVIPE